MPWNASFATPSPSHCPVCDVVITSDRCTSCGADLTRPERRDLWYLDHELARLAGVRAGLVARIREPRPEPVTADTPAASQPFGQPAAEPLAGASDTAPPVAPARPPVAPARSPVATAPAAPTPSGLSVAEILVGLGGLSLITAVVVFAAVAWDSLAAWAQGATLIVATVLMGGAALACRRRQLVATAESLGVVALTLALADVQVARVALEGAVTGRWVWAVGLALVAAGAVRAGTRTGLGSVTLAGLGLAFLPVPVAAAGAPSASVLVGALTAEALAAAALVGLSRDRSLDRAVIATGAAICWGLAALGGLGLAVAGLAADPAQAPFGAAALLAALAAGSLVVGHGGRSPVFSVAGTSLAFVPAVVAAIGADSMIPLLWVLAVQGIAGAVLAARADPGSPQAAILNLFSAASWVTAAGGGVVMLGDAVGDGTASVPVAPAVLLAALSAGSLLAGRSAGPGALTVAGAGLAFLPAPFVAAGTGSATAAAWTLAGQALAAVVIAAPARRRRFAARDRLPAGMWAVVHLGTVASWFAAGLVAAAAGVIGLVDRTPADTATYPAVTVAVLASLAVIAVGAALTAGWSRDARGIALVAAVAAIFGSVGAAVSLLAGSTAVITLSLVSGALTLVCAGLTRIDTRAPWRASLGAAMVAVTAFALDAINATGAVVSALVNVAVPRVEGDIGGHLADRLVTSGPLAADLAPSVATLAELAAVAMVGAAGLVLGQRWGRGLVIGAAVAAAVASLVVLDPPVGVAALVLALGLTVTGAWLIARPDDPETLVAGAVLTAVLVGVSLASVPVAIAATVLSSGVVVVLTVRSLQADAPAAPAWLGAGLISVLAATTLDAVLLGATGSGPSLALAGAAVLASGVAPALERWADPAERDGWVEPPVVTVPDAIVAAALGIALATTASLDGASAVVAAMGAVAATAALRPRRRGLWLVSLAAAVVLAWMRLAVAGVGLVEAYTLPLAAALVVAGLAVRAGADRTSWERVGAGLVAALGPSTVLVVAEAGTTRTVAVILAGVAVTLWGALFREQAPLALGGAAVTAVAVRHLGPVAGELPRYVTFAVAGIVLLATGATFEQRRRDVRAAYDAFTRLR